MNSWVVQRTQGRQHRPELCRSLTGMSVLPREFGGPPPPGFVICEPRTAPSAELHVQVLCYDLQRCRCAQVEEYISQAFYERFVVQMSRDRRNRLGRISLK